MIWIREKYGLSFQMMGNMKTHQGMENEERSMKQVIRNYLVQCAASALSELGQ